MVSLVALASNRLRAKGTWYQVPGPARGYKCTILQLLVMIMFEYAGRLGTQSEYTCTSTAPLPTCRTRESSCLGIPTSSFPPVP
eukprot:952868-Rhodomonas_salina.2